jgi:hypothetical protein
MKHSLRETFVSIILGSLRWLKTALTWATVSNYTTPVISTILAKKSKRMDQVIREVIQTVLHPSNISREDGFSTKKVMKDFNL